MQKCNHCTIFMANIIKKRPIPVTALRTQSHTTGAGLVTSVETARILERRYKIMSLRKDGVPIHRIAELLGVGIPTVRDDIREVMGQTATALFETTEEARNLEITRLDALIERYQPLAELGNMAAAGLMLQVGRERRKLLALDIPEIKSKQETGIRVYVGVDIDEV